MTAARRRWNRCRFYARGGDFPAVEPAPYQAAEPESDDRVALTAFSNPQR
jgi:hypothetical protein